MNSIFAMRWAHVHHGTARLHDEDRQEIHADMLRTLAVMILVGTVLVLAAVAMILNPDMKTGSGYIINQFDPSRTVPVLPPWGSTPY